MLRLENEMETVNATTLADLLGVSRKTIAEWATAGVVVRLGHGAYDLRRSVKGFARHMQARDRGGSAMAEVSVERAALLRLQRERAEFELSKSKKEYLPLAEVNAAGESVVRICRMAVMSIADRIGPSVGLSREGYFALKEECRIILTDLGNIGIAWFEDYLELYRLQERMNHDELSK
jgi:phage terminase Nu1 subunit (DNA packaging protein)